MKITKKAREVMMAEGHENIRSTNKTTFEITKENHLTRRGDCIIAVGANMSAADLTQRFKEVARDDGARITIEIEAGGIRETARAWGTSRLILTHPTDLVVRKSDFVCSRTLAVRADKAARDLSRRFVEKLQDPRHKVKVTLTAETTT